MEPKKTTKNPKPRAISKVKLRLKKNIQSFYISVVAVKTKDSRLEDNKEGEERSTIQGKTLLQPWPWSIEK